MREEIIELLGKEKRALSATEICDKLNLNTAGELKKLLEDKYGKKEASNRIFATTDREKGTLKRLADKEGYETFIIKDDIGGRFSVLTAVGLLPIAVSGADIDKIMEGARYARENMINNPLEKYNSKSTYEQISNIKYSEFEKAVTFLKPDSIFSTDHGVKGEEYDNVIFVIGKGWNLYDFENMLVMDEDARKQKVDAYERNRNLFYVGCSRPRKKLILLITCELKNEFNNYLSHIFGENNIIAFNDYIDN